VAIARALCAEPQLLILDEPTSALDLTVQGQVLELLARLRSDLGIASLFVTHDLHVVRRACDQVLVLDAGRVVETGEMAAVLDAPTHDYSRRLVAATPSIGKAMDLDQFA
jgi:ABC-type glutathione transport system ATPase component